MTVVNTYKSNEKDKMVVRSIEIHRKCLLLLAIKEREKRDGGNLRKTVA